MSHLNFQAQQTEVQPLRNKERQWRGQLSVGPWRMVIHVMKLMVSCLHGSQTHHRLGVRSCLAEPAQLAKMIYLLAPWLTYHHNLALGL